MSNYIRRYTSDPGNTVLLEIESVNILDLTPPASIAGVGSGTVLMVGEFENGPFNVPTLVSSAEDLVLSFGSLGYTYSGTQGQYPCACTRSADSAVTGEVWNGNGFVQLNGKKFSSLLVCRADTSVGSVVFSRLASVLGAANNTYNISNGLTLIGAINGGAPATVTFASAAAVLTAGAGTYSITGGETLTLGYDSADNFTVQFYAGDNSIGAMISRINAAAGFTFASNSSGAIRLTGRQAGTGGQVRVVSGSTGMAAISGFTISSSASGTGDAVNAAAFTHAEVIAKIQAGLSGSVVDFTSAGYIRVSSSTALTGSIQITGGTATDLGIAVQGPVTATTGTAGTIPAGTVVQTAAPIKFVTMQDVSVTASNPGPYTVKVRHAIDDGTGTTATAGTVTVVATQPDFSAFGVNNLVTLSAALSEAAIDSAYSTAITATTDINTDAQGANIIFSARQSNVVRRALRQNAIDASANGCVGRVACIRPPLGTTKTAAKSSTVEPGMGMYRSDRVIYTYPGVQTFVPIIGLIGTSGGTGFTATGVVDVGADGFLASILSQLAPEENPGQTTSYTSGAIALETSSNASGFTITDYTAFKAAGICAPRVADGVVVFQSGVVNVDPLVYSSSKNIARRRMADYIQDSLAVAMVGFGKKINSVRRRQAIIGTIRSFLTGLLNPTNPDAQRIDSFSVDVKSGNTADTLAQGIFRIIIKVRTLSSLDSIVLQTTIGETVTVDEVAA